jgi:hypothetical protein
MFSAGLTAVFDRIPPPAEEGADEEVGNVGMGHFLVAGLDASQLPPVPAPTMRLPNYVPFLSRHDVATAAIMYASFLCNCLSCNHV